jgi:hypothetical protein
MRSVKRNLSAVRTSFSSGLILFTFFAGLLASSQAMAVVTTMNEYFCADDVSNVGSCTANEVNLSGVTNITITDINDVPLSSCFDGQVIKIATLDAQLDSKTGTRWDVLFWIGRNGNDPRVPSGDNPSACAVTSLPDDTGSPFIADFEGPLDTDNCEDFQKPLAPIDLSFGGGNATYTCHDSNNDGMADLQVLTTWWQNTNFFCGGGDQTPPLDINDPVFSPGSPSKCDFSAIELVPVVQVASLTITKVSQGGTGAFGFVPSGFPPGSAFENAFTLDTTAPTPGTDSLTDAAIVLTDPVNGDTFTIDEAVPNGWNLVDASCSNGDDPTVGVTLTANDDVTCTFTDVADGSVTIVKNTIGGDATFAFTSPSPAIGNFNIMTVGGAGSASTTGLAAGTYNVTETPLAGWDLTALSCVDPDGGSSVDINTGTVTIELDAGETITCTYENTQRGQITLLKTTSPSSADSFEFTHNVVGTTVPASPFNVNAGSSESFLDVVPGSYLITESDPTPAYDLENIICVDGVGNVVDSTVDVNAREATVNVDPGETVACEFNNFKRGSLTVVKQLPSLGPATMDFDFTSAAVGPFTLSPSGVDVAGSDSTTFTNLVSGDYDLAEDDPFAAGWELVSATCNDGTDLLDPNAPIPGSVFVDVGQDVSCTFINAPLGSSTIIKTTIGEDDTFDFTGTAQNGETNPMDGLMLTTVGGVPATADFSFQLSPNGNPFTVTEEPIPGGWALTDIVCNEDGTQDSTVDIPNATASINVDLAEAVTCTFTNTADASLVIQKATVPGGLAGSFTFTSDGVVNWDGSAATTTGLADGDSDSQTGQPGLYQAHETVPAGFTVTGISCSGETLSTIQIGVGTPGFEDGDDFVEVTLAAGETVTCEFENTALGSITVAKSTIGGDGSFPFSSPELGGFQLDTVANSAETAFSDLLPGDYMIGEIVPAGWGLTDIQCTGETNTTYNFTNPSVTVSLLDGEDIRCTFTNTNHTSLTLVKTVTTDHGGTAVATDWTLNAAGPTPLSGVSGAADVTDVIVQPGDYILSESNGPADYTAGSWSCTAGALVDATVTIAAGDVAICTINNDDDPAILTLVKTVSNDNGGSALVTDWTLSATGPSNISGASGDAAITAAPVSMGVYTLAETNGPEGYVAGDWSCTAGALAGDQLTLTLGESTTCTIHNDDVAPGLTLHKTVVNGNGGTAVNTDWLLSADGPTPISGVDGDASISGAAVDAGVYTLSESGGPTGYTAGNWSCEGGSLDNDQLTLGSGESAVCTISNDDETAVLTLQKTVSNDNGGTAINTDWTLSADGPTLISGVDGDASISGAAVDAGVYTLSESGGPDGYTASAWSCLGGSLSGDQLTLGTGESASCTINNDDDFQATEPVAIPTNNTLALFLLTLMMLAGGWYFRPSDLRKF